MRIANICLLTVAALMVSLLFTGTSAAQTPSPVYSGLSTWASWRGDAALKKADFPSVVSVPIVVHWANLEPEDGKFNWSEFDKELSDAINGNGYYVQIIPWVGAHSPRWVYDAGVPLVKTDKKKDWGFPYYFDEDYIRYHDRFIRALAERVRSLPKAMADKIAFVQVCEGATGDQFCYKGDPRDPQYAITREQWQQFRMTHVWPLWLEAFEGCDLLFHTGSDPVEAEIYNKWLRENAPLCGLKFGMASHGYSINFEADRMEYWTPYLYGPNAAKFFSRGEMDAQWLNPWFQEYLEWNFRWSALAALHQGLDVWNVRHDAIKPGNCQESFDFFNRHAGYRVAAESPRAFCALRDALDASDAERFPEDKFGKAEQDNGERYKAIVARFASRGAAIGDLKAAMSSAMGSRKGKSTNDIGWRIVSGEYKRYISQIDANATSIGWWRIGSTDEPYGRYARGFEHATGRDAMYFDIDDAFFSGKSATPIVVRVIYLDRGAARWCLMYDAVDSENKVALKIKGGDTGKWKETRIVLTDANFANRAARKSDLVLASMGGGDAVFHMIELSRDPIDVETARR